MFGNNMEHPNRILSYKSALDKYNAIKPIRGRSTDVRPLARRTNDNLTIRQDPTTKDIIITLYSTDIIRYDANGDGYNNQITLDPYASSLTNSVMTSILAPHVFTHWSDRYQGPDYITEVGGRYYHTPRYAVVQPLETCWELVEGAEPVNVPYLNRKEGRQALTDTGYYKFKLWLETLMRLGKDPRSEKWRSSPFDWTPSQAVKYLTEGETGWAEIAGRMSRVVDTKRELESLRSAVYKSELCYDTNTVEYFTSYNEFKNAMNQIKRVG